MPKFNNIFSSPNLAALITGLLLFFLTPQQPIIERFSLFERVSSALVLLMLVLFSQKKPIQNWNIPVPILVLLVIMAISIGQMPEFFVIKDYLAFVLLTFYAILLVSALGTSSAIRGAAFSCGLLILTTFFYAVLIPGKAFDEYGQLQGAFYGPNSLALSIVLLSPALCVFKLGNTRFTFVLRSLLLLGVLVIIYFSTSRTSLVVLLLMLITWGMFLLSKKYRKAGTVSIAATTVILILIGINWNEITSALGKSPDLSGRFPLWQVYLNAISSKPFQGYGWHIRTTPDMPLGNFVLQVTGFPQINANNDLLNWWALTGVFGALFALISVLYLLANGAKLRNFAKSASWIFLTGTVLLIGGFTELSTMHPDGWLLLCLAFVSSSKEAMKWEPTFNNILRTGSLVLK